jgi:hypothetical protein
MLATGEVRAELFHELVVEAVNQPSGAIARRKTLARLFLTLKRGPMRQLTLRLPTKSYLTEPWRVAGTG